MARRAAKAYFRANYPQDRICWVNIGERNASDIVVGITYNANGVPPPYRFFRVSHDGGIEECPREFWPRGWGAYL